MTRLVLIASLLFAAATVMAEDAAPVDSESGWSLGIHLLSIPLVFLFGLFVGWALHERKVAQEEARRAINRAKVAGLEKES